jgi:hypothetical protein
VKFAEHERLSGPEWQAAAPKVPLEPVLRVTRPVGAGLPVGPGELATVAVQFTGTPTIWFDGAQTSVVDVAGNSDDVLVNVDVVVTDTPLFPR